MNTIHNDLTKPKRGRPKEIHRTITKASQNGLHDGWTRATFIVKEDALAKLKDRAYLDRRNLKDVVSEALEHYLFKTDSNGNPTGGQSSARGITVNWQDGPLGTGENRKEPNGAFVEELIQIAVDRINFYNDSKFRCRENSLAVTKLEEALHWLNARTQRRTEKNIEGTHEENAN